MSPSSSGAREHRRYRRIRVNLSVIFRVARPVALRMAVSNKEVRATMLDLSEGGISVLTNVDMPAGTGLLLKFTLFRVEEDDVVFYGPMEIEGEVRYNMPLGGNEYRLGLSFRRVSRQDKTEIAQFVRLQSAQSLPIR